MVWGADKHVGHQDGRTLGWGFSNNQSKRTNQQPRGPPSSWTKLDDSTEGGSNQMTQKQKKQWAAVKDLMRTKASPNPEREDRPIIASEIALGLHLNQNSLTKYLAGKPYENPNHTSWPQKISQYLNNKCSDLPVRTPKVKQQAPCPAEAEEVPAAAARPDPDPQPALVKTTSFTVATCVNSTEAIQANEKKKTSKKEPRQKLSKKEHRQKLKEKNSSARQE